MTDAIARIDAFLAETEAERLADYVDFLRIPSHRHALGAPARTWSPPREFVAERLERWGLEHVEVSRRAATRRVCRLAARRGRADGPRLRPLRRAAGGPARPVGPAAIRAAHRAGSDLRPRRGGRQGPGPSPPVGRARLAGDRGRAAHQHPLRVRGRGGVGLRPTSTAGWRRTAIDSTADLAVISDTGFFEGNHPGHHGRPAGPDVRPDRCHGPGRRPPLGHLGRQRPEPGHRARPHHRGPQARRTAASRCPGFYDEVRTITERGARRVRPAAVRGGRHSRPASGCRSCSASPTSCPSSDAAPGRRST